MSVGLDYILFSLQDGQGPFISLMMVYIFSAMTNLAIDIRLMAFKFLDLVLQNCPTSFSLYAEKVPILPLIFCSRNLVVLFIWTMLCDCPGFLLKYRSWLFCNATRKIKLKQNPAIDLVILSRLLSSIVLLRLKSVVLVLLCHESNMGWIRCKSSTGRRLCVLV